MVKAPAVTTRYRIAKRTASTSFEARVRWARRRTLPILARFKPTVSMCFYRPFNPAGGHGARVDPSVGHFSLEEADVEQGHHQDDREQHGRRGCGVSETG